MKPRSTIFLITLSVFVLSASFGCARYATSDEKITEIEQKISIGMSESEFKNNIPNAQLIDEHENEKREDDHRAILLLAEHRNAATRHGVCWQTCALQRP